MKNGSTSSREIRITPRGLTASIKRNRFAFHPRPLQTKALIAYDVGASCLYNRGIKGKSEGDLHNVVWSMLHLAIRTYERQSHVYQHLPVTRRKPGSSSSLLWRSSADPDRGVDAGGARNLTHVTRWLWKGATKL